MDADRMIIGGVQPEFVFQPGKGGPDRRPVRTGGFSSRAQVRTFTVPRKLTDFLRTPLKTPYLQRAGEPEYHLVDESFDYKRHKG
jgi:hypothetical protein